MELLYLSVWHLEDNLKPPKSEISRQLLLLLGSQRIAELKGIIEILLSCLHFIDENPRFRMVGWISLVLEHSSDRTETRNQVSWPPVWWLFQYSVPPFLVLPFSKNFGHLTNLVTVIWKGLSTRRMSLRDGLTYVNSPNPVSTFQPCKCRNWTLPKQPGIVGSRNISVKLLSY